MMKANVVATPGKAAEGQLRIDWVRRNMPILRRLEEEFVRDLPFDGIRIVVCVHLEAKTAYLAQVLARGGATVAVTGSNPDSTKDDVVAALDSAGLGVYARHGATLDEMRQYMSMALDLRPNIVIDDGGDIVELLQGSRSELLSEVLGVCEETTTGVQRARALADAGQLRVPVILVNEARCKYLFDNVHGTGQSVWDAYMRSTNLVIAGKTVVVVGFGWCGRGIALRAQGLGAQVIVCEKDPVNAADAAMNAYRVMPLLRACATADVIVTATGAPGVLQQQHFEQMRDGVVLANAGHFQNEIDVSALKKLAQSEQVVRDKVTCYQMPNGTRINLLGDGNIVNIACGDGHPAEIMDTSFALQALSARFLVDQNKLSPGVYPVSHDIDKRVASLKLASSDIEIDQ